MARDLYGDSVVQTGTYTSNATPSVSLFWNLASDNAPFNQYSYDSPIAAFSFDNKMWVVTFKAYGAGDSKIHYVYNSTDGINWNIVSDNAPFNQYSYDSPIAAFSFDNKMWVVTFKAYGAGDSKIHYVYISGK